MPADFDPYYKWLGISPDERLPTHYRLLGLIAFESDPEVIEAAADRVMSYLQEVSTGAEMARAQKLLGEVSRARLCLLNAEKKEAYDEKLRARLAAIEADKTLRSGAASSEAVPELQVEDPLSPIESDLFDKPPPLKSTGNRPDAIAPARVPKERSSQEVEDPNVRSRRVLFVAGCAVILLLLFGVGFLFRMISDDAVDEGPAGSLNVNSHDAGSGFSQGNSKGSIPEIPPDPASPSGAAKDDPNKENDANERENAESPVTPQEPTASDGEKSKEPEPAKSDEAEAPEEDDTKPVEEETSVKQPIGFVELQIAPTDTETMKLVASSKAPIICLSKAAKSFLYGRRIHFGFLSARGQRAPRRPTCGSLFGDACTITSDGNPHQHGAQICQLAWGHRFAWSGWRRDSD